MLLSKPEDFEMLEKPKDISEDLMRTFNRNINPIASIRADGNGSYSSKGNSSKAYFLDGELCQVAHHDEIGYFSNHRASGISTFTKNMLPLKKCIC